MSFIKDFPTEPVTLIKVNGKHVKGIKALVEPDMFFIDDGSIIIEEGDFFERVLPNTAKEYYKVIDRGFYIGDHSIPDHYQTKVVKISKAEIDQVLVSRKDEKSIQDKPFKLFISHSSVDKEYLKAFVELLEDIGMPDGAIICSSVPGHGIPGGARIYDWLRDQFITCKLRVVFALSKNYYNSTASLNEMGASWVTKTTDTLLLLPGLDFKDIKGCIDSTTVGIKLDTDDMELKHRLGELKDTLTAEFSLAPISETRWERHRDIFINKVQEIVRRKNSKTNPDAMDEDKQDEESVPVIATEPSMPKSIPLEPSLLVVFAATDPNGRIYRVQNLSGVGISTAGKSFMKNKSPREVARWQGALDYLLSQQWVKRIDKKGQIFAMTDVGYKMADVLKNGMGIDTKKEPIEVLKEFES